MTISQLYTKYLIPINLQEHMYRVAAIGKLISESMNVSSVSTKVVVQALLLHDMGNILKFDLSKPDLLVGEDKDRIDTLQNTQTMFREKYGKTPDEATRAIIQEIGVRDTTCQLLEESHWHNAKRLINTENWNAKIALYADMRVGPFGVLSLHKRFTNLIERRPDHSEEIENLRSNGVLIEADIQKQCSIVLYDISDTSITTIEKQLSTTTIE